MAAHSHKGLRLKGVSDMGPSGVKGIYMAPMLKGLQLKNIEQK
jgi:hypothetical protein